MMFNKYQKFDLKNKIIATIIGFALIILGLIFFIVIPTIQDIKIMSGEIEEQRIDLEKKYIKGNSLKKLMENLNKIEPKLSQLDRIFINKNRELEFITTIENEANEARVSQKINLSLPKITENRDFQKNTLQLATRGGFENQLRYLINLETLSYYINIKSLELTLASANKLAEINDQARTDSQDGTSGVNMFIDADTYWK